MSITLIIIAITCIVSFPALSNDDIKGKYLFWPFMIDRKNEFYRFFTGALLHADLPHLLFNMVSLYSFGEAIEKMMFPVLFGMKSSFLFVLLYILGMVFSGLPDFFKYRNDYDYRALGASGAVSAVIFAAILIYPNMGLRFFFIPIDIPGWLFGILYLGISAYLAKNGNDNIGHSAHFWGGVFGLVFTLVAGYLLSDVDLIGNFVRAVLG